MALYITPKDLWDSQQSLAEWRGQRNLTIEGHKANYHNARLNKLNSRKQK